MTIKYKYDADKLITTNVELLSEIRVFNKQDGCNTIRINLNDLVKRVLMNVIELNVGKPNEFEVTEKAGILTIKPVLSEYELEQKRELQAIESRIIAESGMTLD